MPVRLFLAAELGEPLRAELVRVIGRLSAAESNVKWVAPGSLHLTIKFCGELPDAGPLAEQVRLEASRFRPVEVAVAGVGQFPPKGPPKVVWAGCRGDVAALAAVAAACERAADRVGVERDRFGFTAHITLGRARDGRSSKGLAKTLATFADTPFGTLRVEAVTLFSSVLNSAGPTYSVLERFPLAGKPS